MNIEFPKNAYALNDVTGISFQAIVDSKKIKCIISIEALQDIDLSSPTHKLDAITLFLNNKSRIKEIAKKKILNGDLVDNKLFIWINSIN